MAESLTLSVAVTYPSLIAWTIANVYLDMIAPSIKLELVSNTGLRTTFRLVAGENVTVGQIRAALSFINQGKFAALRGKSLQKWLLEQIQEAGFAAGTVSGTPD